MVVTCYCCMHLAGVRIASSCCALRVRGARDEVRLVCVRRESARARWCGFYTIAFPQTNTHLASAPMFFFVFFQFLFEFSSQNRNDRLDFFLSVAIKWKKSESE